MRGHFRSKRFDALGTEANDEVRALPSPSPIDQQPRVGQASHEQANALPKGNVHIDLGDQAFDFGLVGSGCRTCPPEVPPDFQSAAADSDLRRSALQSIPRCVRASAVTTLSCGPLGSNLERSGLVGSGSHAIGDRPIAHHHRLTRGASQSSQSDPPRACGSSTGASSSGSFECRGCGIVRRPRIGVFESALSLSPGQDGTITIRCRDAKRQAIRIPSESDTLPPLPLAELRLGQHDLDPCWLEMGSDAVCSMLRLSLLVISALASARPGRSDHDSDERRHAACCSI